jgi:hypothetical protein
MSEALQCPASMCPLIAPRGSPWNNYEMNHLCPGSAECFFWNFTCNNGGMHALVLQAEADGGKPLLPLLGPNQPRRSGIGEPKSFECPEASRCRWQERAELAGLKLCPPREALARGMDPRVVIY